MVGHRQVGSGECLQVDLRRKNCKWASGVEELPVGLGSKRTSGGPQV